MSSDWQRDNKWSGKKHSAWDFFKSKLYILNCYYFPFSFTFESVGNMWVGYTCKVLWMLPMCRCNSAWPCSRLQYVAFLVLFCFLGKLSDLLNSIEQIRSEINVLSNWKSAKERNALLNWIKCISFIGLRKTFSWSKIETSLNFNLNQVDWMHPARCSAGSMPL